MTILHTLDAKTLEEHDDDTCFFCAQNIMTGRAVTITGVAPDGMNYVSWVVCRECVQFLGGVAGYAWAQDHRDSTPDEVPLRQLESGFYMGLAEGRKQILSMAYEAFIKANITIADTQQDIDTRDRTIEQLKRQVFLHKDAHPEFGFVYLMRRPNGDHKIGLSEDPARRLSQIQRDFPDTELLHAIKCDDMRAAESQLHERYAAKRLDGEWFNLAADDASCIAQIVRFEDGWFLKRADNVVVSE